MYNKQIIGKLGENVACDFLKENGYVLIERNFKCKQGEIDIISKDTVNGDLVFIEVKTRTNSLYGHPVEAVNNHKQNHVYNSAKYYIYKNKIENIPIRFDVIEIFIKNNKFFVNHIKQAIDDISIKDLI